MKIDKNTPINKGSDPALKAGAKAVGHAFGGNTGAKIASKVVDSKPVQKAVSKLKGNTGSKDSKASKRIKDNLANKARNSLLPKRFRKKKKDSSDSNTNQEADNNTNQENQSNVDSVDEDSLALAKKKIKIKIILWGGAALFLILFIMIVIIAISGGNAVFGSPFASYLTYGTDEYQAVSPKGSAQYQNEIEFYKKLRSLNADYQKDCNMDLNVNYIYASLIYYYYTVDTKKDSNTTLNVDYGRMNKMVDHVADLMKSDDACVIDVNVNGTFYNNLKNDTEFRNYYKELLKEYSIDEILTNIFALGSMIDISSDQVEDTFVSEDVNVNVSNVKTNEVINTGSSSSSNNNTGNTTNTTKKTNTLNVSLKEYLLGITYASIKEADINNPEKLKAYVVAHLTNIATKNTLTNNTITINVSSDSDTLYCNPNKGCSYTIVNGKKVLQDGSGKREDGNNVFYRGEYYYLIPNATATTNINNAINSVYGFVLVNNNGKSETVDLLKLQTATGDNYQNILTGIYQGLKVQNIGENTYTNSVNYGNKYVLTKASSYDQKDYNNIYFCHRKGKLSKNSIGYAGCGITAMAILASTYENSRKYDPIYMNEQAYATGNCGNSDGTYTGFYGTEARKLGYKYLHVGKKKTSDLNLVLSHLRDGHLIVTHVGNGIFTKNGHYLVLGGIDSANKKVYVYDPNNRSNKANRGTGSGWYSFNDIVKQVKSFYIIWKG